MVKNWFEETLYEVLEDTVGYKQAILNTKTLYAKKSDFQEIEIFENPKLGKVLTLDGVVQTTEADEFFYHEMFVHLPFFAHGNVKRVLIIGGGDGGILREVLKHKTVEKATMVEIDGDVVSACKQYLPRLNSGAFENPKAEVLIADGIDYVKNTKEKFDVIIVDSTDPMNVGEVLFTDEFYANAKKCLNTGGVISTQSGVPFFQAEELQNVKNRLSKVCANIHFYLVPVPTYIGGFMALSFATDADNLDTKSCQEIEQLYISSGIQGLKYYNSQIHVAAFALPNYIKNTIK
jgi:spermidine synthase